MRRLGDVGLGGEATGGDARHALSDQCRGVGHGSHHRHFAQHLLIGGRGDAGGDREHDLFDRERRAQRVEQRSETSRGLTATTITSRPAAATRGIETHRYPGLSPPAPRRARVAGWPARVDPAPTRRRACRLTSALPMAPTANDGDARPIHRVDHPSRCVSGRHEGTEYMEGCLPAR